MPTLTVFFPEKDDLIIRLDGGSDATVEDITDELGSQFTTGVDKVCVLTISPGEPFLSPTTSVADIEDKIRPGGYKLYGYIRYKTEISTGPEKSINLTLRSQKTELVLEVTLGAQLWQLANLYKKNRALHEFNHVELYLDSTSPALDKNATLKDLGIETDVTLIVKERSIGA